MILWVDGWGGVVVECALGVVVGSLLLGELTNLKGCIIAECGPI